MRRAALAREEEGPKDIKKGSNKARRVIPNEAQLRNLLKRAYRKAISNFRKGTAPRTYYNRFLTSHAMPMKHRNNSSHVLDCARHDEKERFAVR